MSGSSDFYAGLTGGSQAVLTLATDGCLGDVTSFSSTSLSPMVLPDHSELVHSTAGRTDVNSDVSLCHSVSPVLSPGPLSTSSFDVPSVLVTHEIAGIIFVESLIKQGQGITQLHYDCK